LVNNAITQIITQYRSLKKLKKYLSKNVQNSRCYNSKQTVVLFPTHLCISVAHFQSVSAEIGL